MIVHRLRTSRSIGVMGVLFSVPFAVLAGFGQTDEPRSVKTAVRGPQSLRRGDPHGHGLSDADLGALRTILRGAVDDHTVPGVSLLLAHKGEIIFKEAFGNVALDQKARHGVELEAGDRDGRHDSGRPGKASLDDPVEMYLPEFKGITIKGIPPKTRPTVRHLLCNMAGLPGDFLAESLLKRMRKGADKVQDENKAAEAEKGSSSGRLLAGHRSLADSVRDLAKRGLVTEPGAEFHYCTMGFNVAARVAEVAAQRPFEELSQTLLFEPMGMNNTRYTPLGLQALESSTDARQRRKPVHHGRRRHDVDTRRLRRVLPDAP